MESEKEFITCKFQENFGSDKDKNIIIYGIGPCTKYIVESFPEHQIIGLMHSEQMGESWYGKRILSFEEAAGLKADYILIIARANSIRIVYNRIQEECRKRGLAVYDIHKKNLIEYYHKSKNVDQEDCASVADAELLKRKINENAVISFDIFDTLLTRKVLYPKDVFRLIECSVQTAFDFYKTRREAELNLLKTTNPNIWEIYSRMADDTGMTAKEAENLRKAEIEMEKRVITCRQDVKQIFNYAKACGKEVYLVSDMYLTKDTLSDLLEMFGLTGYQEIFVSCEYRTSKTGYLFSFLQEKCKGKKCLHIGDNKSADIISARNSGFEAFYVPSGLDMLKASVGHEVLSFDKSLENRMAIGLVVERMFNSPFQSGTPDGRIAIHNGYDFSYGLIAPLMTKYMYWLKNEIEKEKLDSIIFPSRDGYLIEKLYGIMAEICGNSLPSGQYFYTSRMASMLAGIRNDQDILKITGIGFNGTPREMLKYRFRIKESEISPYDRDKFVSDEAYILEHREVILKEASKRREEYRKYIAELDIKEGSHIGFCDFVSSGTCQKELSHLMSVEFLGLYFVRLYDSDSEKQAQRVKTLYQNNHFFSNDEYILASYFFLELVLSSYEPSLQSIGKDGVLEFCKENRTESQMDLIKEIHQGIIGFFREYTTLIPNASGNAISLKLCDTFLSFFQNNFTEIYDKKITDSYLSDEICNASFGLKGIFEVSQRAMEKRQN